MRKFGLIGYPLGHSYSADFFNEMFKSEGIDATYSNYEMKSLDGLRDLVASEGLSGFNVTIPHKVNILEQLDYLDPHADIIGAVNTVVVEDYDGYKALHGYNTDYVAFAHAVAYALTQMGIECVFVSRKPCAEGIFYKEIDDRTMKRFKIIVNCTPVGMYPKVDARPKIPYKLLTSEHLLYDLVYNPAETKFMLAGAKYGAQVVNGLDMLHRQALLSWDLWSAQ